MRFGRVILDVLEMAQSQVNHPGVGLVHLSCNPQHAEKKASGEENEQPITQAEAHEHSPPQGDGNNPCHPHESSVPSEPGNPAQKGQANRSLLLGFLHRIDQQPALDSAL